MMNGKRWSLVRIPLFLLLTLFPLTSSLALPQEDLDQPCSALELFQQFVDTIQAMDSFSFDCYYRFRRGEQTFGDCTLRFYLKKPNTYRVEVYSLKEELIGLLVCDGRFCWTTWPLGTSIFTSHTDEPKVEHNVYMKERAYEAHSISHKLSILPQASMTVINLNLFFGGGSSIMEYLEGIKYLREEKVDNESCHVLQIELMKGQRVHTLWLSKKDFLPRKLHEIIVLADSFTKDETWTLLAVNPDLQDDLFQWLPPEGYEERRMATVFERILQVGDAAPDFTLTDSKGKPLALSDYKGKIIWLMFWRIG